MRFRHGTLALFGLTFGVATTLAGCATDNNQEPRDTEAPSGLSDARIETNARQVTTVHGSALARGRTPKESVSNFLQNHAAALGVDAAELQPEPPQSTLAQGGGTSPDSIGLMYDQTTQRYKFSLVRYKQVKDGIPVFRHGSHFLMRNEADHPLVMAKSHHKSLAGFSPAIKGHSIDASKAKEIATTTLGEHQRRGLARAGLGAASAEPELVIWAGLDDTKEEPRVAINYVAAQGTGAATAPSRLVVDAETGKVLHEESLIVTDAVSGTVHGYVSQNDKATSACSDAVDSPFAYAKASVSGGNSAFANAAGEFSIPYSGTDAANVQSDVAGLYFDVTDASGHQDLLSLSVTPPQIASFSHNASRSDEFKRSQADVYVSANVIRDWLLRYHPDYPTISAQTHFPLNVNLTGGICPNAWYDYSSLNFCASTPSWNNYGFGSIVRHEYGHHIVTSGGSGQGEYGEGMGDVIDALFADDPGHGYGLIKALGCDNPGRSADNFVRYQATGCSSAGNEVHDCGQLLTGALWGIRTRLKETHPDTYRDILANLTINSILLHRGTAIDSQVATDLLTLDDDDGVLANGTPHWVEICGGMEEHGIACPAINLGMRVTGGEFNTVGGQGGPFSPPSITYTVQNLGPEALGYSVTPCLLENLFAFQNSGGILQVGESVTVPIALSSAVNERNPGLYWGALCFKNQTSHAGDTTRSFHIQVDPPAPRRVYSFPMNTNPGWTADPGFEFGAPQGLGGDPVSARSGTNVYGYNLAGAYPANMSEKRLTTTAIDCRNLTNVHLKFWRWLGVESSYYDHAKVQASNDGSTWTTVWENGTSSIVDTAWTQVDYDISAIADRKPTVFLRWTLGPTDISIQYAGWNIDDVSIEADRSAPPAPSGLSASPGDKEVSLSWSVAAGADLYNVKLAQVAGGPYQTVATGVATTTHRIPGLANGTQYYAVVSATNANGESANSAEVSFQPGAPCSPATDMAGGQSGNFNTQGAVCKRTADTIHGWGCSNFNGRTVKVNGTIVSCAGALPAKVGDYYYFDVSAGQYPWASIYWW